MKFTSYMKSVLSADSDASSKRLISIYSLFLFTFVVISALFGITVSDSIIYALVSLILGSSAMTLVQNNSKNDSSTSTTSETEKTNITQ